MPGFKRLDRLSLPRPRGGAPEGKRNGNYRHGAQTKATIELWRFIKSLIDVRLGKYRGEDNGPERTSSYFPRA